MSKMLRFSALLIASMHCLLSSSDGVLLVYEGFEYPVGALGEQGLSELGLEGAWISTHTPVSAESLRFGPIETTGNCLGPTLLMANRPVGARCMVKNALQGTLADGDTLWASMLIAYGKDANRTNARLAFCFGDSSFNPGNFDYDLDQGSGLGFTLGRFDGHNGKIVATSFSKADGNNSSGFRNNTFDPNTEKVRSTFSAARSDTITAALVVLKFQWHADADKIEIFLPDKNLQLPDTAHSTLLTKVDQSSYRWISMKCGDSILVDEIRFGSDYEDVVPTR